MKQFGQDGLGGHQGQPELTEYIDADLVPPIRSVKDRQNGASVDQCVTGHRDRKSTRLNSSHLGISYAVFCLKKNNSCMRTSVSSPQDRASRHLTSRRTQD